MYVVDIWEKLMQVSLDRYGNTKFRNPVGIFAEKLAYQADQLQVNHGMHDCSLHMQEVTLTMHRGLQLQETMRIATMSDTQLRLTKVHKSNFVETILGGIVHFKTCTHKKTAVPCTVHYSDFA